VEGDVEMDGVLMSKLHTQQIWPTTKILFQSIIVSSVCLLISLLITPLWVADVEILHTAFELFCIFISLTAFVIIWFTYEFNSPVILLLGIGLLITAGFDLLHAYYYPGLGLYPPNDYDLSTWYWILARLTEAFILCLTGVRAFHLTIRRRHLAIILALFLGISLLVRYQPQFFPVLMVEGQGLTSLKIMMEYVVMLLLVLAIIGVFPLVNHRNFLTYRYILLALLIAVPAELCFTLYNSITQYYTVLGHVLRVAYYCFLFKGIVLSAVTHPYAKLRANSESMSHILNNLPLGVITYDQNSRLTFINQKAREILGYSAEDLVGLSETELTPLNPNSRYTAIHAMDHNRLARSSLIEIGTRMGQRVKLKVNWETLNQEGTICLFDEAKKEQEIMNLQLQTQTILNSVNNLVLMVDRQRHVVMCNSQFESTVEIPRRIIMGMEIDVLQELIHFSDRRMIDQALNGNSMEGEVFVTAVSGTRKELDCHSAPIFNVDQEIVGAIIIASDVTDLRKNQRIMQQQEKLAVLGEMAAGIVHEIRNPLTTIKGFMQLIAAHTSDDSCREYAHVVQSEVDAMNMVVSEFLSFANPRRPVLKECYLSQTISSALALWESQLFIKGIQTKISIPEEEQSVMIDEGQMKQVLNNMIKNAIDAMADTKHPELRISVGFDLSNQTTIVTIADNGVGMGKEQLSMLGTPFYSTKDKGTGLGMSICYRIIKEHRGNISVDSVLGQGTTFTISLPSKRYLKSSAC